MDNLRDIKRGFDNIDYLAKLSSRDGKKPYVIVPGKRWFIQILVNKFGSSLPIQELGDKDEWHPASFYHFRREKIRKNVAIAEARLRNTFRRKKDKTPDMFDMAQDPDILDKQ